MPADAQQLVDNVVREFYRVLCAAAADVLREHAGVAAATRDDFMSERRGSTSPVRACQPWCNNTGVILTDLLLHPVK
jgi:hypothetical protein